MKNQLSEILFSGIVAIRDKLLQHKDPIRMESGDPDFDTPEHIREAMQKALKDNKNHKYLCDLCAVTAASRFP